MRIKLAALLAGMILMMASNAMAIFMPTSGWSTGDNLETFLGLSYFPGVETSISSLDFTGKWAYTAIGAESGNLNLVEEPVAGSPGAGYGGLVSFTTANTSNWGQWDIVNFNTTNLFFEDTNGPFNVQLDQFTGTSTPGFKVYQLTADSNPLGYLTNAPVFRAGTYIIGFNDNAIAGQQNDSDYDDIIIAITPVPEPGTMMLLGIGMLGMAVYGKRRMNKKS